MKKSVMKQWVKALRSGKYKQTRGQLRGKRGYCCLGVLCDVYDADAWNKSPVFDSYSTPYSFGPMKECYSLPPKVLAWSDLKSDVAVVKWLQGRNGDDVCLASINDSWHWGFKKLAAFIEKNYRKL